MFPPWRDVEETIAEAVAAMRTFGVPAAPVRGLVSVIHDADMLERGLVHWVEHPEVGRVCLPSSPLRFADAPAPALKLSPFLNQHEEEVLGGIFGFSADRRAALRGAGATSTVAQVKGYGGQALKIPFATKNGCNIPPECA